MSEPVPHRDMPACKPQRPGAEFPCPPSKGSRQGLPIQRGNPRRFVLDKDSLMQTTLQFAAGNRSRATPGWDSVRQWAADNGLDSPEALRRWIDKMAPRGLNRGIDPRAAALLRELQQFSMASSPGQPAREIQALPSAYDRLLEVLSKPDVGTYYNQTEDRHEYPPGIGGPEWIRPLVDPLAEGGRLWPPSPVTALVLMNEVASRVLGYGRVDSDAMILDLTAEDYTGKGSTAAQRVADVLASFGKKVARMKPNPYGARIDPTAPRLASDVDIAKARIRWPAVAPDGEIQKPYVLAISPAVPGRADARIAAAGPVRGVLLSQGGSPIEHLVFSDITGAILPTGSGGFFKPFMETDPMTYDRLASEYRLAQASGDDPRFVVGLVTPFVRAVRDGQADALGMVPISLGSLYGFRRFHGVRNDPAPYMVRAFEPAEVLAGLLAERRAAAAAAITRPRRRQAVWPIWRRAPTAVALPRPTRLKTRGNWRPRKPWPWHAREVPRRSRTLWPWSAWSTRHYRTAIAHSKVPNFLVCLPRYCRATT